MNRLNIYCISGLAAGKEVYNGIRFPENANVIFLDWMIPQEKETLKEYAKRMASKIDKEVPFVLVGLSFGGIMAQEIAQFTNPLKIILISSVKDRKEIPKRIRWAKYLPVYRFVSINRILDKSIFGYAYWRNKWLGKSYPDLDKYFVVRDKEYLQWSIDQIVRWQKPPIDTPIIQIHGKKDLVFPHKRIDNALSLSGGSHWMVVTHAYQINHNLASIWSQLSA